MSESVQVFGRRHDEAIGGLKRPATEKRQGTKSRWVMRWRCRGRYGDLAAATALIILDCGGWCDCFVGEHIDWRVGGALRGVICGMGTDKIGGLVRARALPVERLRERLRV